MENPWKFVQTINHQDAMLLVIRLFVSIWTTNTLMQLSDLHVQNIIPWTLSSAVIMVELTALVSSRIQLIWTKHHMITLAGKMDTHLQPPKGNVDPEKQPRKIFLSYSWSILRHSMNMESSIFSLKLVNNGLSTIIFRQ